MKQKVPSVAHVTVDGVALDVTFQYFPPTKGERESFMGRANAGVQISPDEEAEVIINSITSSEDLYELLTEKQLEAIKEKILEGE